MNEKTDIVIGNRYERLAFERVMRHRKEMFYASKVDFLISIMKYMIFSDNYEILSNNYFVTYAYSVSCWKYFGTIILINSFG